MIFGRYQNNVLFVAKTYHGFDESQLRFIVPSTLISRSGRFDPDCFQNYHDIPTDDDTKYLASILASLTRQEMSEENLRR